MNLDDLRAAQVDERGTDSLQPLRPSFYEDAAAYLAELRERRDELAERVDDPLDSEEVSRLNDELRTAEEVVEAIYDRRVGKLVKRASLAAAGMSTDEAGLTDEERELFGDLVERIEANRAEVLDALEGGSPVAAPAADGTAAPDPPADVPEGASVDAADVMGTPDESPTEDASAASDPGADERPEPDGGSAAPPRIEEDTDRLTVRITAAVGEIYGVDDRVYTLDAEDVVTLPEPNARPLLDRGAAQRVE